MIILIGQLINFLTDQHYADMRPFLLPKINKTNNFTELTLHHAHLVTHLILSSLEKLQQ